ncbi:glucose N-acetyltransferase [Kluyveromyces lactis]|uniref:Glucose N-acetyltransferase 1-B n=1 Tax=Kluyveromyces lactis (strain ATCC 8585 / CBS 2359 / DSM 70799 / NBRC 1267 / NRRL Y-1140 / WM37) TaxID=284590 RepID=GNT1B_KLULA|nr:uncharacterized protein KLLA0_C14366g [Kluyveromyces lactis]Q6CT96.1 RecName: Full=Glucose N-acetyltransferase 1-B; AltName: Full=N-acetylglucosaminyltransferase B [Kluyveromyces lactis NRRL Y-1140]CAH01694.1 KLLA0C14366p [Kluyveromyces lactis]|eukprot:XP_452843.1 uncharacterized protein KLLA0_C14366g [Kluyveromyces lactis]
MLKRKVRYLLLIVVVFTGIILSVEAIMRFQLNKNVDYYLKFFDKHKDNIENMYDPLNIKQIPYSTIDQLYTKRQSEAEPIDWDKFAYVNYITDFEYLCNTLIQFRKLNDSGSKAKLLALVTDTLVNKSKENKEVEALLNKIKSVSDRVAVTEVGSVIQPNDHTPWSKSLTKLAIFNLTDYERIIYMDNDAIIHDKMDELFFLPSYVKFAAPISYWFVTADDLRTVSTDTKKLFKTNKLDPIEKKLASRVKNSLEIYNHLPNLPQHFYSKSMNFIIDIDGFQKSDNKVNFATHLMVIKPDVTMANDIRDNILPRYLKAKEEYDTDLINEELYNFKELIYYQFKIFRKIQYLFKPSVLILPYTKYGLLTKSIDDKRQKDLLKNAILGYERKEKDDLIQDAKFIHFSDYPLSKPWFYSNADDIQCSKKYSISDENCQLWKSLYKEYLESRAICQVN